MNWTLVQRSPTGCLCLTARERRPSPESGCLAIEKKKDVWFLQGFRQKCYIHLSFLPFDLRFPRISLSVLYHLFITCWTTQIVRPLMLFSPVRSLSTSRSQADTSFRIRYLLPSRRETKCHMLVEQHSWSQLLSGQEFQIRKLIIGFILLKCAYFFPLSRIKYLCFVFITVWLTN